MGALNPLFLFPSPPSFFFLSSHPLFFYPFFPSPFPPFSLPFFSVLGALLQVVY